MSASKPPLLATWLLEHLATGPNKDAVAGDLLEQFGRRGSPAWYWRQVLAAVALDLWNQWSMLWIAVGCTVAWGLALWQFAALRTTWLFDWGIRLPWPISLVAPVGFFVQLNALPLAPAVAVYLMAKRRFSPQRFLRGFLVGVFTLPPMCLLDLLFLSGIWNDVTKFFWPEVGLLPLFFALLLSMWAARTRIDRPADAKLIRD